MKRSLQAFAGALSIFVASVSAPALAFAKVLDVGLTASPLAVPVCPPGISKAQCTIILTKTTALETASDGVSYPTTVRSAGRIVGYTLGLAKLTKADITTLDATYGGPPQVELAVLRAGKKRVYTLEAQSKPNFVQPWFGSVVEFPLTATLPVKRGDVLGLTVPTWAPVLSIDLPAKPFQYRASRSVGCALQSTFSTQNAQLTIGGAKPYLCFYTATRVQYSATEITSPPIPKNAVK